MTVLSGEHPQDMWKRFLIDNEPLLQAPPVPLPISPFASTYEDPQQ